MRHLLTMSLLVLSCQTAELDDDFYDQWLILVSDDEVLADYNRQYCFLFKSDTNELWQQDVLFRQEPVVYYWYEKAPGKLVVEGFGTLAISPADETANANDWNVELVNLLVNVEARALPCRIFD